MSFRPANNSPLAQALIPPRGYQLKWIRHKVKKDDLVEDEANIAAVKRAGWLLVHPFQYPELPSENGRIECDGLVLYMKTIKDLDEYEELLQRQAKSIVDLTLNPAMTDIKFEELKSDIFDHLKILNGAMQKYHERKFQKIYFFLWTISMLITGYVFSPIILRLFNL